MADKFSQKSEIVDKGQQVDMETVAPVRNLSQVGVYRSASNFANAVLGCLFYFFFQIFIIFVCVFLIFSIYRLEQIEKPAFSTSQKPSKKPDFLQECFCSCLSH